MAHQIGAAYNIPHGVANALLLPSVMQYNLLVCRKIYPEIGLALTGSMLDAAGTIACVQQMAVDVGLPGCLAEIEARESDFAQFAQDALEDPCLRDNPRTANADQIVGVFRHAMHRKINGGRA